MEVQKGNITEIRNLLSDHVFVDTIDYLSNGKSALMCASERGSADIAEILIKRGAQVSVANEDGIS